MVEKKSEVEARKESCWDITKIGSRLKHHQKRE